MLGESFEKSLEAEEETVGIIGDFGKPEKARCEVVLQIRAKWVARSSSFEILDSFH